MASQQSIDLVDSRGYRFHLSGAEATCGREASCDIVVHDEQVSRRHFVLRQTVAGWQVEDLRSTNGTTLNGQRLLPGQPAVVALNDRITAGPVTFVACPGESAARPGESAERAGERAAVQGASPSDRSWSGGEAASIPRRVYAASPPARRGQAGQAALAAWYWLASGGAAVGAAMLVASAFLPWVRLQLQLEPAKALQRIPGGEGLAGALKSGDGLAGVLKSAGEVAKQIVPPAIQAPIQEALRPTERVINGSEAYGTVLLLAAITVAILLACDLGMRLYRSSLPGVVYLLAAIFPAGMLANDVIRFATLGKQEILFGVTLGNLIEGAGQVAGARATPLAGLYMAGAGLGLLLCAGLVRMACPYLGRIGGERVRVNAAK